MEPKDWPALVGREYDRVKRGKLPAGRYKVIGLGHHDHTRQELVVCQRLGAEPGELMSLVTLHDFDLQFKLADTAPSLPEKVARTIEGNEGRDA